MGLQIVDGTGSTLKYAGVEGDASLRVFGDINSRIMIGAGSIAGYGFVEKVGRSGNVSIMAPPVDIWERATVYEFSTTADIDAISSSDVTDEQAVLIVGLDTNFDEVSQTATLDGQNKIELATPLIRVFRVTNQNSTDFVGTIYVYVDGNITAGVPDDLTTVRAQINIGFNRTLMAIHTIPNNKTGYLTRWWTTFVGNVTASGEIRLLTRLPGGVFTIAGNITISPTSPYFFDVPIPIPFPEKTDIKLEVSSTTTNNSVFVGGFEFVLIDD